jgi:hypothetical protein
MNEIKKIEMGTAFGCYIELRPSKSVENFIALLKKIRQQFPVMYNNALSQIKELDISDNQWWDKEVDMASTIDTIKTKCSDDMNKKFESYKFELHILLLSYFNLTLMTSIDNVVFVGRPWCTIGDDETGAEFKLTTQEIILSLFNEKCINCAEV